MPGRHRRASEPNGKLAKATGAGAAGVVGVAAVLGMSPAAHAAVPHGTSHSDPGTGTSAKTATKQAPAAATPNYGYQKFRVGVQLKDGSYAPTPAAPNTMTGGTEFTITETDGNPADTNTITCTTQDASQDPGTTRTWCPGDLQQPRLRAKAAALAPRLITRPSPTDAPQAEFFLLPPGYTATITQSTVRPNLVKDSSTAVIQPCVANFANFICLVNPSTNQPPLVSTDEIFEDTGLPPVANDDSADTGYQQPTTVDVLGNDETHGAPVTGLHVTSAPGHGSAHVVSTGSGREIRYRPDSGFTGTDTFQYTLKTGNGTSTATVTVHVAPPPPSAHDDSATTGQGQGVDVNVLANDDTRGRKVTGLQVTSGPKHGGAHVVNTSSGREIRYTPDSGYTGTDTFDYVLRTDGGSSQATVTIHVDAAPDAVDDTAQTNQDTAVSVPVLDNDHPNGSGPLTIISTGTPGHGSVQIDGADIRYTPDHGYVGPDSFTYTVHNNGGSASATVRITVNGSGNLAETGVDSGGLLELGGLLLGAGAMFTAAGRRYRRHA